jgi:hypothetical protein
MTARPFVELTIPPYDHNGSFGQDFGGEAAAVGRRGVLP